MAGLIHQIRLPNGRATTNLGFGCASLMRIPNARERDRLLKTAFDAGITHFDVARMYGLGAAEGVIGASLASVRDQITLATKFGLPFSVPGPFKVKLQSVARRVLKTFPGLKKGAKRAMAATAPQSPSGMRLCDFSADEMTRSLKISLSQLRTGHVDLFFLHEPTATDIISVDLPTSLEAQRQAGTIGAFGLSAFSNDLPALLQARPDLVGQALQYSHSILKKSPSLLPDTNPPLTGFFSVINEALPPISNYLKCDPIFAREWSGKLNLDLRQPDNIGIVILATALVLNNDGLVLFSTTRPERLRTMMQRLQEDRLDPAQLLGFRDAVAFKIDSSHAH